MFTDAESVQQLHQGINSVFQCIFAAHSNVARVKKHISEWSSIPLYQKCSKIDIQKINEHLQQRVAQINDSGEKMRQVISENLKLFVQCGNVQKSDTEEAKSIETNPSTKRNRFKQFIGLTYQLKKIKTVIDCVAYDFRE